MRRSLPCFQTKARRADKRSSAPIVFGYRHCYYEGLHGALLTGMISLLFGLIYLWIGKRNILPLVRAHSLANSISQTSRFLW